MLCKCGHTVILIMYILLLSTNQDDKEDIPFPGLKMTLFLFPVCISCWSITTMSCSGLLCEPITSRTRVLAFPRWHSLGTKGTTARWKNVSCCTFETQSVSYMTHDALECAISEELQLTQSESNYYTVSGHSETERSREWLLGKLKWYK